MCPLDQQTGETKMDFKVLTDIDFDKIVGTSRQGSMHVQYVTLVNVFGEPLDGDGVKTDAEWIIEFSDGTIATIYNYKNGVAYYGNGGIPTPLIRDWNIGGHSAEVVTMVENAINNSIDDRNRRLLEEL
jgi:hypothetical protein